MIKAKAPEKMGPSEPKLPYDYLQTFYAAVINTAWMNAIPIKADIFWGVGMKVWTPYSTATIFEHGQKYFETNVLPWLAENNITKFTAYRIFHYPVEGEKIDETYLVATMHNQVYGGFGVGFKNPAHALMFKLAF